MTKEEIKEYQRNWHKNHPDYQKQYLEKRYILIDKKKPIFPQLLKVFIKNIKNFLKNKKGGQSEEIHPS